MRYVIKKGNKYMDELFPIGFNTKDPSKAYSYGVKQIAQDIALANEATIEELNNEDVFSKEV